MNHQAISQIVLYIKLKNDLDEQNITISTKQDISDNRSYPHIMQADEIKAEDKMLKINPHMKNGM